MTIKQYISFDCSPFGSAIKSRAYASGAYRYGFNNQEKDDDLLGVENCFIFKYRMSNTRLGRFLSVDPLSDEYAWNSSYAFAENSVIAFIELEGLEKYYSAAGVFLGKYGTSTEIRVTYGMSETVKSYLNEINTDATITKERLDNNLESIEQFTRETHSSEEMAAKDFLLEFNDNSIRDKVEYGSFIRKVTIDGKEYHYYGEVTVGKTFGVETKTSQFELDNYVTAGVHTHANYLQPSDNNFSDNPGGVGDVQTSKKIGNPEYLGTPNGSFKKYDPKSNTKTLLSKDLPSDSKDPTNNGIDSTKETRP